MSFRLKRSITAADLDLHDQAHCDCQSCARARRQNAVTRGKEYWLENDTVVVQVERTLYKLSRGWLIRKSDYFRNLLKDHPTSPDVGAKRLIVDANIVYVVEAAVSSHDFEQLLVCIDKGLEYAFSLPSFLQVASVLRAATALSFPIPLAFARRAMEVMWSSDLDKLTDTPLQYAALAVHLAHKYELGPNIRKRALYELLRREDYAQTEPWLKHHGRSESFRDLILPSATADGNPEDSSNLHFVSQEDLILLILVRQRLQSEWYTMTMSPRGISDFCTNAINGCKAPLEHPILWNKVAKALETLRVALVDPLKGLQRIRGYDWEGEGYCDTCVTAVECWCADEQVRLWTLLDEWFCANIGSAAADGRESEDGDNAEQDQEHASDV